MDDPAVAYDIHIICNIESQSKVLFHKEDGN